MPISISIKLGDLDDSPKSLEACGHYLRSFDAASRKIDDEPESAAETVLTLNVSMKMD